MPAKLRAPKGRLPTFTPEVLALFAELEHMRGQDSAEFKAGSKRLAGLLGLSAEWWAMCHVNDRSKRPCWPPQCAAFRYWHRVHEVRRQLLAAVAAQKKAPAALSEDKEVIRDSSVSRREEAPNAEQATVPSADSPH